MVVSSWVSSTGPTGVEMEALTAVAVAALTVYDMCKAIDKGIEITESGSWKRAEERAARTAPL